MNTAATTKTPKGIKILFWATTTLIFLFEGVLPAFTSQSEMARQGIQHLQYPLYFGNALVVFKVLGAILLMLPKFPLTLKEWAYAGFTFDFIFASISHFAVDGVHFQSFFPLIVLGILGLSYYAYRRISAIRKAGIITK